VYCELFPYDVDVAFIKNFNPKGIILSGGPDTVTTDDSARAPQIVFDLGVPILGICYGMQTMAMQLGGKASSADKHEYGFAQIKCEDDGCALFTDLRDDTHDTGNALLDVWMSHGIEVNELPADFKLIASTDNCAIAGFANSKKHYYGLQFHPEVTHTKQGAHILERFVSGICNCEKNWTTDNIITDLVQSLKDQIGDNNVLLGLSGGVDSSVVAVLLHQAIGDQLMKAMR